MNVELSIPDRDRQFIDTNVLVYAYDRTAGIRRQKASTLLRHLWETRQGCLSIQVMQEFYATVTQKVDRPLSNMEATNILRALSTWRVHVPTVDDVLAAISLKERFQISFWDAMIVWSATQLACPVLWTEDLNDGQRYGPESSQTQVQNPFT